MRQRAKGRDRKTDANNKWPSNEFQSFPLRATRTNANENKPNLDVIRAASLREHSFSPKELNILACTWNKNLISFRLTMSLAKKERRGKNCVARARERERDGAKGRTHGECLCTYCWLVKFSQISIIISKRYRFTHTQCHRLRTARSRTDAAEDGEKKIIL